MFSMMLFMFFGFCAIIALLVFCMIRQDRTNQKILAQLGILSDLVWQMQIGGDKTNKFSSKAQEGLDKKTKDLLGLQLEKPVQPKTADKNNDLDLNF
ncbi:MAG: hypothetical protein IJT59_00740 [Desulfovibrionaceae bacterium]|nr:hypothetical protein [Desulfovibrionaceae bacterium]